MTSAITSAHQSHVPSTTSPSAPGTTNTPPSRAVPAQLPGRSYATVSKTATPTLPPPAGASAPAQNAKPHIESPLNGTTTMAQGGSQSASSIQNGTPSHAGDHGRKPSVVISASGASGYTPNGGPVGQSNGRPNINFGSINSGGSPLPGTSVPYQPQSSLPTPPRDPRATSPAHSPSPIPQPPTSGGRPPSGLQTQSNNVTFGSLGDGEQTRQNQMSGSMGPGIPMHERRQSSQSMQSDMSNQGMNRNFMPPGGRGRGFTPQPYGMPSPAQQYRQVSNPGRPQSIQQPYGQMSPAPPFNRGNTRSPAVNHAQPNMHPGMAGNPQMPYGSYNPQMGHQQQHNMYPQFDPQSGYYPPYGWYQQGPSQSPRPNYPSPYQPPQSGMQPPFHPPTSMSRSTSQASERPASSMGQPQTPSMQPVPPAQQTPASSQPPQSSQANFVRPKKASSAIVIKDANGNPIDFNKKQPSPSASTQPQTPVIVSTPNAPTPPPRAPSGQHNRVESKSTKTAEETKNAFQEQVKRQLEEEKRRKEEEEAAKPTPPEAAAETKKDVDAKDSATTVNEPVKEAVVEAEKAAAVDAGDKEGEKSAAVAESALAKDDDKKEPEEETEDERLEREIAEMEAAEKAEEEREKAFQEKRKKEKAESAKKEAEAAAKADEELKRQEREAEAREEQREREREAEKNKDDGESKDSFATLAKPTVGPGAETPASGAETPASEDTESSSMPPPAQPTPADAPRAAGAQKPKPAHLKLETNKGVEPSEPTPGMQALKTARFLEIKEEAKYPDGFKSPNPALNNGARRARAYDKDFLLQFQSVFKEKPSVDWDQKVKDTLGPGDEPSSARLGPGSARTPSNTGRSASNRPVQAAPSFAGPMGNFGNARTLPAGTTSQERFAMAQSGNRPAMGAIPMGARAPSQLGMGATGMSRTNSLQQMGQVGGPGSPRQPSTRGRGGSRRGGDRAMSTRQEAELASKMPLTAHSEVAPLSKSNSGWKPTSIGAPMASQPDPSGNMAPDMVQRKVKAALNKMTPENFEKISDQILAIAAQSKNESDGRTLRQVIQLTFEKACDEAHWAAMYAQFCSKMLTTMSTDIRDETIKDKAGNPVIGGALFRKYLLNRCQEEFERGWQVNLPDKPEGESQEAVLLSDEYYVAAAAKRRGLGLIVFIGQLYRLKMLTLRIMHECVLKLLNFEGEPDEAAVETLTTLLRVVGASIEEEDKGPSMMDAYFDRIDNAILKNDALASRSRFMIMDLIDLRKARWRGKGDAKGPKTITQIHEEAEAAAARAEAEKARSSQRGGPGGRAPMGRGDARNFSGGMQPPVDYTRTTVGSDDLRRLQQRNATPRTTGGLGPGGSLGPGGMGLGTRAGSRRGAAGLAAGSSGNTTRTNTPPAESKEKKEEPSSQNAFGALAALDPSGEAAEDTTSHADATSPPAARNRSKSPLPVAGKAEESAS